MQEEKKYDGQLPSLIEKMEKVPQNMSNYEAQEENRAIASDKDHYVHQTNLRETNPQLQSHPQQFVHLRPQSQIKTNTIDQQLLAVPPSPPKQQPNLISEHNNIQQIESGNQDHRNKIEIKLNGQYMGEINRLERKVEREVLNNRRIAGQLQVLSLQNKQMTSQLATSKAHNMELKKKQLELRTQAGNMQRELSKLKEENVHQQMLLKEAEKIGNIFQLRNNFERLQALFDAQQGQLEELRRNSQQNREKGKFAQNLAIFTALQAELNKFKTENAQIRYNLSELAEKHRVLNYQHDENMKKLALLEQQTDRLNKQTRQYQEELAIWHSKWDAFEIQRAETKRAMQQQDQKVTQYESELAITSNLSLREEKDLLLKDYLVLQTNYQAKQTELEIVNARLKQLERQYRSKLSSSVPRKQYNDLMGKYTKAKSCLESAFERIRKLERSDQSAKDISDHIQELLQGNETTLCNNLIRQTTQKLQWIQQRVQGLEMSEALMKSQQENAKNKRKIALLEKEIKSNEKLMRLLNEDNEVKTNLLKSRNSIIDKLKICHSHPDNIQFQLNKAQQEVKRLKDLVTIYETKCIILIRENQSFNGQFQHWKKLYYSLKDSVSHRIQSSLEVLPTQLTQQREEQQAFTCAECEFRKIVEQESAMISQGTQTENLSSLHLKEICETISVLRKMAKIIEEIPITADKTYNELREFKEKYQKYAERYIHKMEELNNEKEENDRWRMKAKEQIREEFQDIRELVMNDRLTNTLRTAKNLIDYLEKETGHRQQIEEEQQL